MHDAINGESLINLVSLYKPVTMQLFWRCILYSSEVKYLLSTFSYFIYGLHICLRGMPALSLFTAVDAYILL